jgi:drug/metabolite transporter (DMT)-like permease
VSNSKVKPILLGLLAVLLWAAIPAFVKVGSAMETLTFLLVLRFAISSLIFVAFAPQIWRKRHLIQARWFLLMSLCLGANFYFQGLAMIKLPVSWYLIIFSLNPLFALLLMGVRLRRRALAGVLIAVIGTFMFIDIKEIHSTYGVLPIVYVVIGMLTWVVYTLIAQRFQKTYSNVEVTALTQYAALAACAAIWMVNGFPVFEVNANTGAAVLALGTLTPLAYFGFNACLRAQPRFGVVSQYLEPVFGVFIGLIFFHESFSLLQALGSILIVLGSAATES